MSTKTTIKRIALVAVSALGLGMLSVVPSQAVAGTPTLTVTTGSASVTAGASNETTTAATVNVYGLLSAAQDSYTVQAVVKSRPASSDSVPFKLAVAETTTLDTIIKRGGTDYSATGYRFLDGGSAPDSTSAFTTGVGGTYVISKTGYAGATFGIILGDSTTTRVAGTYVITVMVQAYDAGVVKSGGGLTTADVTFTINKTAATLALESGTIDPSKTTAVMNAGSTITTTTDSSVVAVATASTTNHAVIQVKTYTSASLAAPESVTVTLTGGAGVVCTSSSGGTCGTSLKIAGDGDDSFYVRANGVAGVASIVVATTTKTFPAKLVTFYAAAPSTITIAVNKPVISVAAASAQTDVVRAVAKDASGNNWAGQLYIAADSAADALIAGSTAGVACTYNSTYGFHACPLKGTAKGTAKVKVHDATNDTDGTIAVTDAAVASATASVRVSTGSATSVKIAFDKATYAPGEKALVTVRVLDEDGNAMPAGTINNVFAAAPTTNTALGSNSAAIGTNITIEGATDADTPTFSGAQTYIVYMPQATGTVTYSATGSTGLAAAGRVAVSASADVVNESVNSAVDAANEATDAANAATDAANAAAEAADAATAAAQDAQAAVAALATQVASLIAGIKAQITSLTNLVIKIQKKVRA